MSNGSSKVRIGDKHDIERFFRTAAQYGEPDQYKGKRYESRIANALMLEASLDPRNPADVWAVTMKDISEGGVSFWAKQKFPIRTPVHIREYNSSSSGIWLAGNVTHCTSGLRGYLVGVAFKRSADTNEPDLKTMGLPGATKPGWRRPTR